MKIWIFGIVLGVLLGVGSLLIFPGAFPPGTASGIGDDEIRKAIVRQSLASYPGPCPCPYSVLPSGHRCDYDAYTEPGGYSPICYPSDVNLLQIYKYRAEHPPK